MAVKDKVQPHELRALMTKVYQERGVDLSQYKPNFVQRRVATRLRARGVSSFRAYMRLLDEEEYDRLLDALTINLTSFFRDTSTFVALRDEVLRPMLREKEARGDYHLNIWSAGCASGEEPYSVAIILHQLLGARLGRWHIRILGTDLDEVKLAQAREGVYGPSSFRSTTWPNLDRYFVRSGHRRVLRPEIKRLVHFRRHDLMEDPPPQHFDLILCRNVLIYFQRAHQVHILQRFHRALHPGGYLVLGKTEILPAEVAPLFETSNMREHIYIKRSA